MSEVGAVLARVDFLDFVATGTPLAGSVGAGRRSQNRAMHHACGASRYPPALGGKGNNSNLDAARTPYLARQLSMRAIDMRGS